MGVGDADVYKAFCWRFWSLVRADGGRLGIVLPRSAYATLGSEDFRRAIFSEAEIDEIVFLLNRNDWVFDDAEHRYTIALSSICKAVPNAHSTMALRGPFATLEQFQAGLKREPMRFRSADALTWSDSGALPLLPSQESGDVFLQLRKAPRLDLNQADSWRARPHRELDATNDEALNED